jgi:hypothetical protein
MIFNWFKTDLIANDQLNVVQNLANLPARFATDYIIVTICCRMLGKESSRVILDLRFSYRMTSNCCQQCSPFVTSACNSLWAADAAGTDCENYSVGFQTGTSCCCTLRQSAPLPTAAGCCPLLGPFPLLRTPCFPGCLCYSQGALLHWNSPSSAIAEASIVTWAEKVFASSARFT